jgi:biotin carboxylase
MVFKPVDTSGSLGVTKLLAPDDCAANVAFERARSYSRSGTVCVEEFVAGIEVGGDGVLRNGQFAFIAITHKHLDGFVVRGHNLPTNITVDDQRRVRFALEECCAALGYRDGPLNFDVMVSPERIVILEMSARNGGNGIPTIIARSTGVDVEVATITLALDEEINLPVDDPPIRGAGSLVFGSERAGVLRSIRGLADIQSEIPEVFDLYLAVLPGSVVNRFEHNGNLIGCALFDCEPPESYDAIATRIIQALCLVVTQAD